MREVFVTVEGLCGAGKSTIAREIRKALEDKVQELIVEDEDGQWKHSSTTGQPLRVIVRTNRLESKS